MGPLYHLHRKSASGMGEFVLNRKRGVCLRRRPGNIRLSQVSSWMESTATTTASAPLRGFSPM